jgi:hypothetical protein
MLLILSMRLVSNDATATQKHDVSAGEAVASLVLVTHGIGQNVEGSNIAHDTDIMRDLVRVMHREVRHDIMFSTRGVYLRDGEILQSIE